MRVARRLFALSLLLACVIPVRATAAEAPPFPDVLQASFDRAKASMMSDPAGTLREIAAAEAVARRISDRELRARAIATALWLGAEANLRSNAPDKAGPMLTKGLGLIADIKEPIKLRGDLLMSQGAYFMQSDDAARALENFQNAFRVFGQVNELRSQAIALQNIALLYSAANDNNSAEKYFRRAAATYSGDPALSVSLHNNRGNVLMVLERYRDAEGEYLEALELARGMDNPLLEARVLGNLARDQVEARKFDAAELTLDRGFTLTKGAEAVALRRHLLATAARLAADRGNYDRAVQLIRECFSGLDLSTTGVELRTAHLYAYRIFRATGDLRSALAHLEALRRLSDEAVKVATTTNAALMAAKFDYQGQQLRIEKLTSEQLRRTAEFQRTLFLSLGGATLLVIVLLSVGLVTIRRSRNQVRDANIVLNRTNVALEKALKAKTEFLATTSHEIRTPLNGILGMTQVMLSDPTLGAETRDRIDIVHGAGVTMRALVDDILDVAKMETGNLSVEATPMDLCETLREVTPLWEEQARGKGLSFRLELSHAPQWIVSDPGRLRQIVFNLLSNAIKFTEKGAVTLRAVDEGKGEDRRLQLAIIDTGIGVPADQLDAIFESFRQVDTSTTRRFGGTGLGLTICRNLARALGGDIHVESVLGEGSTFTVDLPLVPAEAPRAAPGTDEETDGAAMLIVDRNPIARSMLRTLFEPRVATLRFAANPAEAHEALAAGGITHLIVDESTLKAGGGDPIAALAALVSAAGDAASAILWMKPDIETRSQLLTTGIGSVVEKPIAGADLIDTVIPDSKQNPDMPGKDPLVSRAA